MDLNSPSTFEPDQELLDQIQTLAYDLMSWKDIAFYLHIPPRTFKMLFDNENSSIRIAYQSGRIKREHELRVRILRMATQGSPQAELLAVKFLDQQYYDEIDE